jgi:N-acetylneuraminic acid mutarotase
MKNAIDRSSILGGSAPVGRRAATTLLNQLVRPGVLLLLACLCLSAHAQQNEWTWMGGNNMADQPGVYGTLGTPAAGNIPGGRQGSSRWTDSSGHLWLFGGNGFDATGTGTNLNDLWKFDPSTNQWAWMGGGSTVNNSNGLPGVYGALGTPAAGNIPGSRMDASSWTDSNGHLWLFGGYGIDANGTYGPLNDLWEFNPSTNQWAWMSGSSTVPCSNCGQSGVYGSLATPAAGNNPGSRHAASSWTDSSGNLWLFGGSGYDADGNPGSLSDLWEFDPSTSEWAWMGGSSTVGNYGSGLPGVYGTLGMPAAGNIPGGRYYPTSWTGRDGSFWLFGGSGWDANGTFGRLNDLWKFDPSTNEWAWMGGSSTVPGLNEGPPGVYGALGTPAAGNVPGGRYYGTGWTDSSGNLWLFGGWGYDASGNSGQLNDLWAFNPSTYEWAWMGGSSTANQPGVYGTLGTPAAGNIPGSRWDASSWTDSGGKFWLFGGWGYGANFGYLDDMWKYQPLAPSLSAVATPTFSPAGGTYTSVQTVSISDATAGATIYYTLDGSTPTTASATYSAALTVSQTTTINAIAVAAGYSNSAVASATYTINLPPAATPVFTPAAGTYTSIQKVKIADSTTGATVYYTLDGSTPTTASAKYTAAISVSQTTTINAIAVAAGFSNSAVASAAYTINLPPAASPTFNPAAGTYTSIQTVTLADSTTGASIYYTLDGSTPTTASAKYSKALTVSQSTTINAIAVATEYSISAVASATYTLNLPPAAAPAFTPAAGAYTSIQKVKLSDSITGASIYYTLDGSTPTTASAKYTAAITVSQNTTINAIAVATGYSVSAVSSAIYIITLPAAAPTFTPAAGAYGEAQLVTLASATPNPTIYYTTDGSTPTESSTQYTGPIAVSATTTIKAIATAIGYTDSPVASAKLTLYGSPQVLTGLASAIATPTATLNATVNDFDAGGDVWFVWGTDSTASSFSTPMVALPASADAQSASATLTGLTSGTTYYFRPVATTIGGTSYGAVQSFTAN